jgi:hypothetical protein
MRRNLLHGAASLVVAYAAAGVLVAQTTSPATTGQAGRPGQVTGSTAPVVYTGCLKQGSDLAGGAALTPGASPSAPLSGYILTSAQVSASRPGAPTPGLTNPGSTGRVPDANPGTTSPGTSATPPAAATSGTMGTTASATSPASAAGDTGAGGQTGVTTPGASQPALAAEAAAAAQGGSSTAAGAMYRIVGLPEDQLRQFANQRVEITGTMESPDKTATVGTTGRPTSSQPATTNPATGTSGTTAAVGSSSGNSTGQSGMIPTFRATSVRVLSSSCSAGTN